MGTYQEHDEELRFAEELVRRVRDETVEMSDRYIDGVMRGRQGDRWRRVVATPEIQGALRELMPDIVDMTISQVLYAVEHYGFALAWQRRDGSFVTLRELGGEEMVGWWEGGSESWISQFSRQRWNDDFPPDPPKLVPVE